MEEDCDDGDGDDEGDDEEDDSGHQVGCTHLADSFPADMVGDSDEAG